jgi:hypothetical protein
VRITLHREDLGSPHMQVPAAIDEYMAMIMMMMMMMMMIMMMMMMV